MSRLEQELGRARNRPVEDEAGAAVGAFVERAADGGLLDVAYTTLDSPVGDVLVAATQRGLVRVAFGDFVSAGDVLEELSERISPRVLEADSYFDGIRHELDEYFQGRRTRFDLPLDWQLTDGFGRRVLRRTARIAYGDTATYSEVAAAAGSPQGARAAGNALGANPIPIVVPCHRVLRAGGDLGGYGGGIERKEFLLKLEGAL